MSGLKEMNLITRTKLFLLCFSHIRKPFWLSARWNSLIYSNKKKYDHNFM